MSSWCVTNHRVPTPHLLRVCAHTSSARTGTCLPERGKVRNGCMHDVNPLARVLAWHGVRMGRALAATGLSRL